MIRALETFCQWVEVLAGLLLGICTILVCASAVGRYLFAWPIPDAFDISRLLIGACIMWGFASVGYRGGHIKVDLFAEMMSPTVRRIVDVFAWAMLLFFVTLLTWKMFDRVESAMRSNEATFDLRISVWPLMSIIWAGTAATMVTVVMRLYLIATGRGELEHAENSEFGDE
ncbi:TRAP transporter small permease [Oricola sp.]|uniref:TRAP transporter small permease n=1 Tax=Oricola sp. TaxID=1979950 RepID=UPI0025EC562D|nr:TRAP transporter small permease [Oricola sp.]MCI5073851.1 TRAP transporter small permease [Oricola sp.]